MNVTVSVTTFLAAGIEVIEMVAIVVAVGSTRSWRAALVGAGGGLVWWLFPAAAIGSTAVSLLRATMKPPGAA